MARYKPYSYGQGKFIPIHFEKQILPGTFEYSLNHLINHELDLTFFDERYKNEDTGAPAYDPRILLKIVLFAYSRGIVSSRRIAQACEENIIFMALSADSRPHFTTIADFIATMDKEIVHLFRDVLLVCDDLGLIGKEMFAIDGCKLPSNASKEWSGTRADFEKKAAIGGVLGGIMIKNGYAEKNSGHLESSPIHQQTSGANSPNINAPNAKTIQINYGIPEKVFNGWVKQLKGEKGKDKVIEYLLDDLKQKNVTISVIQGQIQDGLQMRKELEKRLAEKSSTQAKTAPLTKFTHQEFIDNFVAFRAYYQYRKTLELLNPDMLIELLNVYFRSVLLYPSNEMNKYYITDSGGRLLLLQIQGHDEKGKQMLISLPNLSGSLLKDVCTDFIESSNLEHYEMLLTLFDRALSTPELDKAQRSNILDAQTFIKKNKLFHS